MKNSNKPLSFAGKEIAYLGLLVAAAVVGRSLFQPLPNVQPMTVIFLLVTIHLGLRRGLIVCLLSMLITNFYMGMGIWTIAQLVSYAIIILGMYLLSKSKLFMKRLLLQVSYSVFAGFAYGFVISWISVKLYGFPSFWVYYFQGLSFDALHAIGNGIFYLLLAPLFLRLFQHYYPKNNSEGH